MIQEEGKSLLPGEILDPMHTFLQHSPCSMLSRLQRGKCYLPEQFQSISSYFEEFRENNSLCGEVANVGFEDSKKQGNMHTMSLLER